MMMLTLEQLWDVPLSEPVQPRPVDALTSLDEHLVHAYRMVSVPRIGRHIAPQVAAMLAGDVQGAASRQLARDGGFALWESEFGRTADSIGL
jgi:hypothetical protein